MWELHGGKVLILYNYDKLIFLDPLPQYSLAATDERKLRSWAMWTLGNAITHHPAPKCTFCTKNTFIAKLAYNLRCNARFSIINMQYQGDQMSDFCRTVLQAIKYRVIQILCMHTDGCRSPSWLAHLPVSGPSYWRYFQTLTLLFQVIFRVDGHVYWRTFAKRRR